MMSTLWERMNFRDINAAQQCSDCKHRTVLRCKAFPDGIPKELLNGRWDHREPYPGDNGFLYEPSDPMKPYPAPYAKNKIEKQ